MREGVTVYTSIFSLILKFASVAGITFFPDKSSFCPGKAAHPVRWLIISVKIGSDILFFM
jgi:hypothetical protein